MFTDNKRANMPNAYYDWLWLSRYRKLLLFGVPSSSKKMDNSNNPGEIRIIISTNCNGRRAVYLSLAIIN